MDVSEPGPFAVAMTVANRFNLMNVSAAIPSVSPRLFSQSS